MEFFRRFGVRFEHSRIKRIGHTPEGDQGGDHVDTSIWNDEVIIGPEETGVLHGTIPYHQFGTLLNTQHFHYFSSYILVPMSHLHLRS